MSSSASCAISGSGKRGVRALRHRPAGRNDPRSVARRPLPRLRHRPVVRSPPPETSGSAQVRLSHPLFSGPQPSAAVFDFRPTFVTLRPWKRTLSASDSGPTPRRAKSHFLSVPRMTFPDDRSHRAQQLLQRGYTARADTWPLHAAITASGAHARSAKRCEVKDRRCLDIGTMERRSPSAVSTRRGPIVAVDISTRADRAVKHYTAPASTITGIDQAYAS